MDEQHNHQWQFVKIYESIMYSDTDEKQKVAIFICECGMEKIVRIKDFISPYDE